MLELVKRCRSYRRFFQDSISEEVLLELVNLGRFAASGKNLQPLKYAIIFDKNSCVNIYSTLKWAGHIQDWDGPIKSERPTAYIVILHDTDISKEIYIDHGIAIQNILLGAVGKGLGGCIIAAIDRAKLRVFLNLNFNLKILNVLALGKPKEIVKIVTMKGNDFKYYRDKSGTHFVPKRSMKDILITCK
jgi:nitroreductase